MFIDDNDDDDGDDIIHLSVSLERQHVNDSALMMSAMDEKDRDVNKL